MTRFQKLVVVTILATFLLMALGGFVRAAGAGLGCPDWPRCFDRWIPPTSADQLPPHVDPARFNFKLAWIEYVNRLVGVAVGFLILATALVAWRDHRRERRIFAPVQGALVAVAFQGWFGGQVVAHELDPRLVTVHLFVALLIVALLLYAAFAGFFPAPAPSAVPALQRRFARMARLVIALVLVQIFFGALVRGSIDLTAAGAPGTARGLLLGEVGALDHLHRATGLLTLLSCWGLFRSARRSFPSAPGLRRLAVISALVATGQFGAGLGLTYLAFPPVLQVVHVALASLLLGTLILTALRAGRPAPG